VDDDTVSQQNPVWLFFWGNIMRLSITDNYKYVFTAHVQGVTTGVKSKNPGNLAQFVDFNAHAR